MNKEREVWLDIIKGIAVMLIVLFHAGFPIFLFSSIMVSVFFICSGYVFKNQSFYSYIKKQFFHLLLPFVAANFISTLIHNLLTLMGMWPGGSYKVTDIVRITCRAFLFGFSDGLCAPHWFAFMIFTAGASFWVIHYLSCIIAKKLCTSSGTDKCAKITSVILLFFSLVMFIVGICANESLNKIMWSNCAFVTNIFYVMILFAFGYMANQYKLAQKADKLPTVVKLVIFVILSVVMTVLYLKGYSVDHRAGLFSMKILVPLLSAIGFMWFYFASKVIEKIRFAGCFVSFAGRNSLYVMLYHAMAFQLVTFVQVKICHIPYDSSWQWQNIYMGSGIWVCAAGCVGITVPLGVAKIKQAVRALFRVKS